MAAVAKRNKVPLAVHGSSIDELAELTKQIKAAGVEDLVLAPIVPDFYGSLTMLTQVRRLALKQARESLGYPIITFPGDGVATPADEAALAAQQIAKYAGLVVLDHFSPELAYALLVLRQNIFTDPQKPIQVQPGLYEINDPRPMPRLDGDHQLLHHLLQRGQRGGQFWSDPVGSWWPTPRA